MNIVPNVIQAQANRLDRTPSLIVGISSGLTALWAVWRVFWLLFSAVVYSGVGVSAVTLVISAIFWAVFAAVAGVISAAFILRYLKTT